MSARATYRKLHEYTKGPGYQTFAMQDAQSALDEIDSLRCWKAEAMSVLREWEDVWEAAGRPGPLGATKAASVRALVER